VILRANDNTQLTSTAALIAQTRVEIQNLDIQGQASRDFGAGILLTSDADGSRIRGVRVSRTRNVGISLSGVSNVRIESSPDFPTVVVEAGFGSATTPLYKPGIGLSSANDVTIDGARLGIDDDGSPAGNCSYGVEIDSSMLVTLGAGVNQQDRRNIIGDNGYGGVHIVDSSVVNIHGNYIGLGPDGVAPVGNGLDTNCLGGLQSLSRGGVVVRDSNFISLGSTLFAHGSYITANHTGVNLINAQRVTFLRNQIGRRPNGSILANSGSSILITGTSGQSDIDRVLIGTTDSIDRRNVIVGDGSNDHGIRIYPSVGRVEIHSNSIYGHGLNPIDRGIPPYPPVLTVADPGSGQIAGTLIPDPNPGRVDLFADLAGHSQARYFLGLIDVPASAGSFSTTINSTHFQNGRPITAIFTTDSGPGSSRLSEPLIAETVPLEDEIFQDSF